MSNKSKIILYKILAVLSTSMIGIHGGIMLAEYRAEGIISDPLFSFGSIIAMLLALFASISQWRRYYRLVNKNNILV